jgi:4-hydroxythreonine-4-phosphate dehydrogenase
MTPAGANQRRAPCLPLVLTMGDPAGIGGETALKAWREAMERNDGAPGFFIIDDPARLTGVSRDLELDVPVVAIDTPAEAQAAFPRALPVLPLKLGAPVRPGEPDRANAPAILESVERAVGFAQDQAVAAIVTNPIQKKVLYGAGFRHPGHTEFLAELAGAREPPVMMLACPGLRVVPVTIHMPLKDAIAALSTQAIVHAGRVTAAALQRDFGITRPRLAVAGLNPHAGEGGALGREETETIEPAVAELRRAGLEVTGPAPADSLFHRAAREAFDAALCMYHDQALIPLKTVDFDHGVNITLGLPFIRTSPDHGTALSIAGKGIAQPFSLTAAIETARRMADARAAAVTPSGD